MHQQMKKLWFSKNNNKCVTEPVMVSNRSLEEILSLS